jgi:hypothetical protein
VVLFEEPSPPNPFVSDEPNGDSPAFGCENRGTTYDNWIQAND